MTKREEYAKAAMQAILSTHVMILPDNAKLLAKVCFVYADAMVEESRKRAK